MALTTDSSDPNLHRTRENGMNETYLVLSDEERAKGFVRPVRDAYIHVTCGTETRMAAPLAETYARQSSFYSATFCARCKRHFPVADFRWSGTNETVGS